MEKKNLKMLHYRVDQSNLLMTYLTYIAYLIPLPFCPAKKIDAFFLFHRITFYFTKLTHPLAAG